MIIQALEPSHGLPVAAQTIQKEHEGPEAGRSITWLLSASQARRAEQVYVRVGLRPADSALGSGRSRRAERFSGVRCKIPKVLVQLRLASACLGLQ